MQILQEALAPGLLCTLPAEVRSWLWVSATDKEKGKLVPYCSAHRAIHLQAVWGISTLFWSHFSLLSKHWILYAGVKDSFFIDSQYLLSCSITTTTPPPPPKKKNVVKDMQKIQAKKKIFRSYLWITSDNVCLLEFKTWNSKICDVIVTKQSSITSYLFLLMIQTQQK